MKQDTAVLASEVGAIEAFLQNYFCMENAAIADAAHTFEPLPPRYLLEGVAFDSQRECYTIHFMYCGKPYLVMIPTVNLDDTMPDLTEWQRLRLRKAITKATQEA